MNRFFTSVFGAGLGKTAAHGGFFSGQPVHFSPSVRGDAVIASITALRDVDTPGNDFLRSKLHSHEFP